MPLPWKTCQGVLFVYLSYYIVDGAVHLPSSTSLPNVAQSAGADTQTELVEVKPSVVEASDGEVLPDVQNPDTSEKDEEKPQPLGESGAGYESSESIDSLPPPPPPPPLSDDEEPSEELVQWEIYGKPLFLEVNWNLSAEKLRRILIYLGYTTGRALHATQTCISVCNKISYCFTIKQVISHC